VLRQRADEVKAVMRENSNTRGVNDNWNESVKVRRFVVDQDKARALGVTSQSIAQALRVLLSGNTVGQFREGDKLIDMVSKEVKKGKISGDVKEIVVKIFSEFYQFMWTQRSYWEPRLKNVR
jgi:multidrug efflux pump subunit AcrB